MNLEVEKYTGELSELRKRSEILDRLLLERAFPPILRYDASQEMADAIEKMLADTK